MCIVLVYNMYLYTNCRVSYLGYSWCLPHPTCSAGPTPHAVLATPHIQCLPHPTYSACHTHRQSKSSLGLCSFWLVLTSTRRPSVQFRISTVQRIRQCSHSWHCFAIDRSVNLSGMLIWSHHTSPWVEVTTVTTMVQYQTFLCCQDDSLVDHMSL